MVVRSALVVLLVTLTSVLVRADGQAPAAAQQGGVQGPPPISQDRPLQSDGIVRLLLDLESAVASGRVEDFRAIATPGVTPQALRRFEIASRGGARAIVRERTRRAAGQGYEVIVDVLVSRQAVGRISTWQMIVAPGAGGQFLIDDLRELAGVDGLLKLSLDTARQFAVKDLVINAPDLTFKMPAGSAFVAESPNGITALVLRGKAEITFAPSDPAEQGQVRIFSGRPALTTPVEAAFLRINPAEFVLRVSDQSLTPVKVDPIEVQRATQIFDDMVPRTYNVDLRSLTPERWSLEPAYGSLVLEFKTARYGWLSYARSPSDPEDISVFDRDHQRNISLYMSEEQRTRRNRSYSDDDGSVFDIDHQRLDLTFDPSRLWVSGRASVQLHITAKSAVSSLTIRLAQPLAVASVSSGALGDLLALRIIGQNTILVGLPDLVERDATIVLDVVYGGRLEPQALDREAIQVQGQRDMLQEPSVILTPESRYLYSNRVPWYPQGASSDYSTAELRLSVPSEYQIVASGSLLRSSVVPNNDPGRSGSKSIRVVDYLADRPVRYLSCVISRFVPIGRVRVEAPAVAPPSIIRPDAGDEGGGLNLEVVSTSRMTGRNRQTTQRVASMLSSFAKITGEAPYPDFTLAALDDNLPGGHSPAYFAVFHQPLPTTPYSWANDPVAFDDTYAHFFLAHEVAHQWWGQAVGWKNYHDQWISEGLAQYFAALYAAEDRGPDMLETLIEGMRKSAQPFYEQGPISLGYRLGHIKSDSRVFRAIVYNKAAVVVHMLRRLIGDDAFFRGIKRFYTTWRFQKAGTEDFEAAMAAETPIRLNRFFDQWIYGFGRPRLRITWHNPEGEEPLVRVEQSGEVFDLPLTVVVQFADGRSETRTLKVTEQVHEERMTGRSPVRRVSARDDLSIFELGR